MEFPLGELYIIVNSAEQALRIQSNTPEEFDNARVVACPPDGNDLGQFFMVEKTGMEEDSYEIVNCLSGNVFDEEGGEIRLRKGKQVADQLFKMEHANNDFYWIKCEEEGDRTVAFEGILRYKEFNPNDPAQMFKFYRVDPQKVLPDVSVLVNNHSGKALDVPNSTFEHDTRIIQYSLTKRFNQRWKFVPQGKGYMIQSLLNGLVLDIAGESTEGGSPVIQWEKTGGTNQIWLPLQAGPGIWKLASVHAPGMCLCMKDQSVNNYGKLEIWDQENPSMYWRIDGFVPQEKSF